MEISELTLWIARLGLLALMYLFLLVLIIALRADARAASQPAAAAPAPAAPAPTPIPALLQLIRQSGTSPSTGDRYLLNRPLEIGRGPQSDIAIPNRFVSTRHARVAFDEHGWFVEDLGSTNGTLVNGDPLTVAHRLASGDRITVGDTEFLIQ